jgi:hypothetical protein
VSIVNDLNALFESAPATHPPVVNMGFSAPSLAQQTQHPKFVPGISAATKTGEDPFQDLIFEQQQQ